MQLLIIKLAQMVTFLPGGENVDEENTKVWFECDQNLPAFLTITK